MVTRQLKTPILETSIAQSKALAIAPKVSSLLSVLGSGYIIYDIIRKPRRKWKISEEILLGMGVCDMLCSIAWFFSTWPIPPKTFPVWGASGTLATCTAQGVFHQFSLATIFYNGFLAIYYFLVIKHGWKEERIRRHKLGPIAHGVSLAMGIGSATVAVSMGLLNPIGWDCWISAVPLGCQQSWQNGGETTCVRGDNATLYQWMFFFLPLWIVIILVSVLMFTVTRAYAKRVELASAYSRRWMKMKSRLSMSIRGGVSATIVTPVKKKRRPRNTKQQRKNRLTLQMALYVGSFYVVWFFPTVQRIAELIGDTVWFHWVFLTAATLPLQGLFNMIVYVWPRIDQWLRRRREALPEKTNESKTLPDLSRIPPPPPHARATSDGTMKTVQSDTTLKMLDVQKDDNGDPPSSIKDRARKSHVRFSTSPRIQVASSSPLGPDIGDETDEDEVVWEDVEAFSAQEGSERPHTFRQETNRFEKDDEVKKIEGARPQRRFTGLRGSQDPPILRFSMPEMDALAYSLDDLIMDDSSVSCDVESLELPFDDFAMM